MPKTECAGTDACHHSQRGHGRGLTLTAHGQPPFTRPFPPGPDSGWRLRHPAVSADDRGVEAVDARLRQADDLLSAVGADAGGNPRDPSHLDAAGPAAVPTPVRRRF